jgi:hypothetical protein
MANPNNWGVAASWNLGLMRGKEFTIFLSSTMRFKNGVSELIAQLGDDTPPWALITNHNQDTMREWWGERLKIEGPINHGWHCVIVRRKVVETVGYVDENFAVAYCEDQDYGHRINLAGLYDQKRHMLSVTGAESRGNGRTMRAATNDYVRPIKLDIEKNSRYFERKWGGQNGGNAKFTTPFDSGKPLWWWPPVPNQVAPVRE